MCFSIAFSFKFVMKINLPSTQDYHQRNRLFYIYQSGFRANYSTHTCLSRLTDIILNGTANGKYTDMILIDLWEVFDTLNHKMLLDKEKFISFSGKTIEWFPFYFTKRTFYNLMGNVFSEAGGVNCRVPIPSPQ